MYRCFAQNPTARKEGGIHHQQETQQVKNIGTAYRMPGGFGNQIGMDASDDDQPGYQRGVFHGIPCPIAPKIERFVSPGRTHQNTRTQDGTTKQCPGQCRFQPFGVPFGPQPRNRIRKRNGGGSKTQKEGRRVDGHPVVLQSW